MQILTKHIFKVHRQIYKGLKTPSNYVDGIIINTDRDSLLPLGTKCIYPINIKNKRFTKVVTPFPIKYNGMLINRPSTIRSTHLKTLGESLFLYKHKLINLKEDIKASSIPINEIIENTKYSFSSTFIMDIEKCNIYFLNKFLKLPYNYKLIICPISKEMEGVIVPFNGNMKISFTMLNLNDCKSSFTDNFNGVGVKIQLFTILDSCLHNIYEIFACLYSNDYKDLYYFDGLDSNPLSSSIEDNINKLNKFIKLRKNINKKT